MGLLTLWGVWREGMMREGGGAVDSGGWEKAGRRKYGLGEEHPGGQ